jgi:hypothetical protein
VTPIPGDETICYGIKWNVPIETGNIIQSDSLKGDVVFNAVQARNMPNFTCSSLYTEVCDGADNNYNDLIDEGWPNLNQSCAVGVGACLAEGNYVCDANNSAGPAVCSSVAGNPGTETCNGLDDNCDGQVDEDNPGGGGSCQTGLQGACSAGILQCQSGALQCVQNNQPSAEICGNGLDDDCDGTADNLDTDGDGYLNGACQGYDCNDSNTATHPGGLDIPGNDLDENCSGMVACYADAIATPTVQESVEKIVISQ